MSNQTPVQEGMPKGVQRVSYTRIPMTCDDVRRILDECKASLMEDLCIDSADEASVDGPISIAFQKIRDEVTHKFRDDHMRLLNRVLGGDVIKP